MIKMIIEQREEEDLDHEECWGKAIMFINFTTKCPLKKKSKKKSKKDTITPSPIRIIIIRYIKSDFEIKRLFLSATTSPNTARCDLFLLSARREIGVAMIFLHFFVSSSSSSEVSRRVCDDRKVVTNVASWRFS